MPRATESLCVPSLACGRGPRRAPAPSRATTRVSKSQQGHRHQHRVDPVGAAHALERDHQGHDDDGDSPGHDQGRCVDELQHVTRQAQGRGGGGGRLGDQKQRARGTAPAAGQPTRWAYSYVPPETGYTAASWASRKPVAQGQQPGQTPRRPARRPRRVSRDWRGRRPGPGQRTRRCRASIRAPAGPRRRDPPHAAAFRVDRRTPGPA